MAYETRMGDISGLQDWPKERQVYEILFLRQSLAAVVLFILSRAVCNALADYLT